MSSDKLRDLFDRAVRSATNRQLIHGVIGKSNSDTPNQCIVPGRPNYCYVRTYNGSTMLVGIARTNGVVGVSGGVPVLLYREGNNLTID